MTPEMIYEVATILALVGWLILVLAPLTPRLAQIVAGGVIPLTLAALYSVQVALHFGQSEGDFASLPGLMLLFADPAHLAAAWVHFLAFDLWIGAWQVRKARALGLPHLLILPCLALTFLFGPAGLLLFCALWGAQRGLQHWRKGAAI
jgi:hypothetical protein